MKYYYFTILFKGTFDEAIIKTKQELEKVGFGILTEIDLKSTFKNKLNIDFYNYKILGACNPEYAFKALKIEDKIGTMLPCNVIVQEKEKGIIEVSIVDPIASMQAVKNEALGKLALEIRGKLKTVIYNL